MNLDPFYLDVIKDRQYTCKKDSKERTSAQQSMFFLTKMLLTWIAPICPHTAEEAWQHIPKNEDDSIFFNTWLDIDINGLDRCNISNNNWNEILEVKKVVSKALEEKEKKNMIGSSDADITIYCSRDLYNTLNALGEELKFIFITSSSSLRNIDEYNSSKIISLNNNKIAIDIINSKMKNVKDVGINVKQ